MAESFDSEDLYKELERYEDGLVSVARDEQTAKILNDDGSNVELQLAMLRLSETDTNKKHVPHENLVNRTGYKLRPYTAYAGKLALLDFGDSLVEAFAQHEDILGMYSTIQAAKVAALEQKRMLAPHADYRDEKMENAKQSWQDYLNFSTDLERFRADGVDTWVRLEYRHQVTSAMADIVVARLVKFQPDRNHDRIIPIINNYDNKLSTAIPQSLTFGEPWLYIGSKTTDS